MVITAHLGIDGVGVPTIKGDLIRIHIMRRASVCFVALLTMLTIDQSAAHGVSSRAQYTRIQAIVTEPVEKTALSVLAQALKQSSGTSVIVVTDLKLSTLPASITTSVVEAHSTVTQSLILLRQWSVVKARLYI